MLQNLHSEPRNKETLWTALKKLHDYLHKIIDIEGTTDYFRKHFVNIIIVSFVVGQFLEDFTQPSNWSIYLLSVKIKFSIFLLFSKKISIVKLGCWP